LFEHEDILLVFERVGFFLSDKLLIPEIFLSVQQNLFGLFVVALLESVFYFWQRSSRLNDDYGAYDSTWQKTVQVHSKIASDEHDRHNQKCVFVLDDRRPIVSCGHLIDAVAQSRSQNTCENDDICVFG
jgi:hypothetical protein